MPSPSVRFLLTLAVALSVLPTTGALAWGQGDWEMTAGSRRALEQGLEWLARNQGPKGNWESNDLGLVSLGAMAFLAAGHAPGRGRYGREVRQALDHVLQQARPSGLLNASSAQRDMYNHGLSTFVLGQAYGMTTSADQQLGETLARALRLIAQTQCDDGGWDYRAQRKPRGHDLSLAVMQAKALRSAMDSGLEVPTDVVQRAIASVREHYWPRGGKRQLSEAAMRKGPGQFTYSHGGGGATLAMAAAGVVCMQEYGQYDDWRIAKNLDVITAAIQKLPRPKQPDGTLPFDAYTLYYAGQSIYQAGGPTWKQNYPLLRDYLVASQRVDPAQPAIHASWRDKGASGRGRLSGKSGDLFATSVACFLLAIPNRFLPILQEGHIQRFEKNAAAESK